MWHFDVTPCVIQPELCNEKPTNNNNAETIFYFGWFLPCTPPASSQMGHIGCKKVLAALHVVTNRYCRVFEYGADSDKASDHWQPGQS